MKQAVAERPLEELIAERADLEAQLDRATLRADAKRLLELAGSSASPFVGCAEEVARICDRLTAVARLVESAEEQRRSEAELATAQSLASALAEYLELRQALPVLAKRASALSEARMDAERLGAHARAQLDGWRRNPAVREATIWENNGRRIAGPPASIDVGAIERAQAAVRAENEASQALSRHMSRVVELEAAFPVLATIS